MPELMRIARRDFAAFFTSPVAYIFLGAFLAVSLFVFFWVETFFARNIADSRPLFEWMPVLLIFLVAALTMRSWSEERRSGTLELLATAPVATWQLVLGKFLAGLALVLVALALTLPVPISVSLLGNLDWGPVFGAYLAALLLAASYLAIGLFVSSRTDNQIVSLIGTVVVCGLLYLVGSHALTDLFGHRVTEFMQAVGTGARFESITRGVIDLRDLFYYLSLTGIFLTLNVYTLEQLRWADDGDRGTHKNWRLAAGLLILNLFAGNLWLSSVGWARIDLTEGNIYSLSDTTRGYLERLHEPLLIRGYFSAQTHPLLAPLVPQLRDLLEEYEIAGDGKVQVEFVDPQQDPEVEREAGQKFGIKPVAFQTASKYQAAVVNSYFDLVIQYGDEFEKLSYSDLIEVKLRGIDDLDVRLRNPEYDITRTIKKVSYAYQAGGDAFADLSQPITFKGFISGPERLPQELSGLRADLDEVLAGLKAKAGDKLQIDIRDPDADGGQLAEQILEQYGFRPLALGLLDPNSFYFYMVLESGAQSETVPLPEDLDQAGLERSLEAALKRFRPGVLRTVALVTPPNPGRFGMGMGPSQYARLEEHLKQSGSVKTTDLKQGRVPTETDLLVVVDPKGLDDKQVFAIDQFLMQGGTLVLASSAFEVDLAAQALSAFPGNSGLDELLASHGITLEKQLVMDPQNMPFPIPVQRDLGGFMVQEIRNMPYPYFPDLREAELDQDSGLNTGIEQLMMSWASPISIDAEANRDRQITEFLHSSPDAWTTESADIQPDFQRYPTSGFASGEARQRYLLGAVVEGEFESFFKGKPSPLLAEEENGGEEPPADGEDAEEPQTVLSGVVESSPGSARIILIGSGSFLNDGVLDLAMDATGTEYQRPLQLIENLVDWSLEDRGLLELRGRGQFSRLLAPMESGDQLVWEYLNYGFALGGLVLVWLLHRRSRIRRRAFHAQVMQEV